MACISLSAMYATGQTVGSRPKTDGEQRLLEWDLNKSYTPKRSGSSSEATFGSKTFTPPAIEPKAFATKTAAEAATFYTPEFLSSPSKTLKNASGANQSFSTTGATAQNSPSETKKFQTGREQFAPKSAALPKSTDLNSGMKEFAGAGRIYAGEEADRMKRAYTPDNPPKGGVSMGRQLSVDEVREILNKSK
ncbi:MAG: hypothetical protein WCL08_04625 [Verrucomicrobiota bacterium]